MEEAIRAGVEGQRAEIYAAKTAVAAAALAGQNRVSAADLRQACCLLHCRFEIARVLLACVLLTVCKTVCKSIFPPLSLLRS